MKNSNYQDKSVREASYTAEGELKTYKDNSPSKMKIVFIVLFLLIVLILVTIVFVVFRNYISNVFTFLHS